MSATHPGAYIAQAFGASIIERLAQHDLELRGLAEFAGIHYTQLRRMLEGEDAMNTDHLAKIARALGVSPAELLESAACEMPVAVS